LLPKTPKPLALIINSNGKYPSGSPLSLGCPLLVPHLHHSCTLAHLVDVFLLLLLTTLAYSGAHIELLVVLILNLLIQEGTSYALISFFPLLGRINHSLLLHEDLVNSATILLRDS